MARGQIIFVVRGRDQLIESLMSIAEAAGNAHLDDLSIDWAGGVPLFEGMPIHDWLTYFEAGQAILRFRPAPGMILYIGWLMTKLPSRASVIWRDGWPIVHCPPHDDRDDEEPIEPLRPDCLEPLF